MCYDNRPKISFAAPKRTRHYIIILYYGECDVSAYLFFYGISVYKVPVRMIVGETRDGVPFNRFVSQSVPPNIYF